MDSAELRAGFLVDDLFAPAELRLVITDMDRVALGGVVPQERVSLPSCRSFGTEYFTERREMGVVNLGEPGHVWVGADRFRIETLDFLYIGAGNPSVSFEPCEGTQPIFYFLSCPAHRNLPAVQSRHGDARAELLGDATGASRRRLSKVIHPGGAASCQLVMGLTELESGSVWNTMPPHTHSRRSEVYLYTALEDGILVHLMGEPAETRHLIVRDREAVLSPSWSLHSGVGTKPYSFIWGMAGENQSFTDMDVVELDQLR